MSGLHANLVRRDAIQAMYRTSKSFQQFRRSIISCAQSTFAPGASCLRSSRCRYTSGTTAVEVCAPLEMSFARARPNFR